MAPLTTKHATSPNVIKPIAKAFVIGSNRKTNLLVPTPYSLHMCLILSLWQTIASRQRSLHNLSTRQSCKVVWFMPIQMWFESFYQNIYHPNYQIYPKGLLVV
jgi:hypothetical protein